MRNNKILLCTLFSLCLMQIAWGLEYKDKPQDKNNSSAITAYIEKESPVYLIDATSHNTVTDTWVYNEVKTLHLDLDFSSVSNRDKFVSIKLPLGMNLNSTPTEYINGVTIKSVDTSKFGVEKVMISNSGAYTPRCGTVKFNITEETQSLSIDLLVSVDDKFWNTVNGVTAHDPAKNSIEIEVGDYTKTFKKKLNTIYVTGRNWESYGDINISDYVQTGKSVVMGSTSTMDYVQTTRSRIYNEAIVKMDIPYTIKVENGVNTKKYATITSVNLTSGGTYEIKNNQIIVKYNNALLSTVFFSVNLNFDSNVFKENDLVQFQYGELWVNDYFTKQSVKIRNSSTKHVRIARSTENVHIGAASISAFNNKNDKTISHLSYFQIVNDGADSANKRVIFDFPYGANSGIGVTTVRMPTTIQQQQISVEYILWEKGTNREYSGTIQINKSATTTVHLGYLLTVSNVAKSAGLTNKEVYFKQVKYIIGKIPYNYKSYARYANYATSSSGTIWGKVFLNTASNTSYAHKMTLESLNDTGAVVNTIHTSCVTSISASGQVPVYVNTFNFYNNAGQVIKEMNSGRDFNIKGNVSVASYPYTNTGYLSKPIVRIKVPKGISINKKYTRFYSSNNSSKFLEYQITNESNPKELANGEVVYEIAITNEGFGNYTETLNLINSINFEIRLSVGKTVKTMSINGIGLISIEDKFVKANAGGTYDAWYIPDIWDVNNNGSTHDRLATVNYDIFLNINSNTNCLDTDFFISVNDGEYTRDSVTLNSPEDNIKVKFSIDNIHEGYVLPGEFEYTITIPKKDSSNNGFSLELLDFIKETAGFEILYSTDRESFVNKTRVQNLEKIQYIKIKSTKRIEDNYSHDFIINLKYTANSYNKHSFKVINIASGYQTYRKGTSANSIYHVLESIYTYIDSNRSKPSIIQPISGKLYNTNETVNVSWLYNNPQNINKAIVNIMDEHNKLVLSKDIDNNMTSTSIKALDKGMYRVIVTSFNKFGISVQSDPLDIRVGVYNNTGCVVTNEITLDSAFNHIALLTNNHTPDGTSILAKVYYQVDSNNNVIISDKEGYCIDIPLSDTLANHLTPTKIPIHVSKVKVKLILINNTKPYIKDITPILENITVFIR